MTGAEHTQRIREQFSPQAEAYSTSTVHAEGADLVRLKTWLATAGEAHVLDIGCGAGHASFSAAPLVKQVTAYDLSAEMLAVVERGAQNRGLTNIDTQQGVAESLPFADQQFDRVMSRYSAHHWQDVPQALREVYRVLKPGGRLIIMDIASPGAPLFDIWLQSIEVLRDPSHVRNYSPGEWLQMTTESGLRIEQLVTDQLALDFQQWVARMKTPEATITTLRTLQQAVSAPVQAYFQLQPDGSFHSDTVMFSAQRPVLG
ncbi:class I SAM-dependent methyltransferase [Rosenbergiella australiborealis]|uniref:Class I SAM-dependent methyltransferase n=1 Tax=Rosenbergiella australiborealis TaxID=1544696 RepID=A0ABS5T4A7_9GAMM|nr:class I SAM-dependent methyltransferase [Rosenbergiella australiborealis]MBT0727195.1 class I SAM-dependent methyltransferase [Rosenbergiella australiborealis]